MSIFSRLFGSRASSPVPAAKLPSQLNPIPGKLKVHVHSHGLPDAEGAFVTIVSEGLGAQGQREILLTMRAGEAAAVEAQVEEIASFFAFIHQLAGEGKIVDAGGFTRFGERGLLGRSNNGLVYVDATPLPDVPVPPRALAALVLAPEEIALASAGGTYRLLARLGEHYRFFPFPRWNDLQRPSLVEAGDAASSVLLGVERGRVPGVSLLAEADHLRILVAPQARATIEALLASPPSGPCALLTDPATAANAWLVWKPEQTEPTAITPPGSDGSRTTGYFLLVCGGVERDDVRMVEDGYSLLLSPTSLASFWSALANETPFALNECEGMTCALEWSSDRPGLS